MGEQALPGEEESPFLHRVKVYRQVEDDLLPVPLPSTL